MGNDLTLIVSAAGLTYAVRHHQSAALAALYQIGSRHFPVRSSLISSSFRCFILRADGHGYTSLNLLNISRITAILGSASVVSQLQVSRFRFVPQRPMDQDLIMHQLIHIQFLILNIADLIQFLRSLFRSLLHIYLTLCA